MELRIGLNCLHLSPGRLGGLETYMLNLLDDLSAFGGEHEFFLFCAAKYASFFEPWSSHFQLVPLDVDADSTPSRIAFEQFQLARHLRENRIDVLHSSGYTAPLTKVCRTVMTVHDLNYLEIPGTIRRSHGSARWAVLRLLGPLSMRRADRLVALSNHVAARIVASCGIAASKIDVLYNRSPTDFAKLDGDASELPELPLGQYLLYVASWYPHKNHRVLFDALALAQQREGRTYPLVLAGLHFRNEKVRDEALREVAERGLTGQVTLIERHLSTASLAHLYRHARALVFPSTFEGFGIPILEAMSAGIPVLCSDLAPMTEVGGDAVIPFAPDSPEMLLAWIGRIYDDDALRTQCCERGLRRYAQLAAESQHAGSRMIEIYRKAAGR